VQGHFGASTVSVCEGESIRTPRTCFRQLVKCVIFVRFVLRSSEGFWIYLLVNIVHLGMNSYKAIMLHHYTI